MGVVVIVLAFLGWIDALWSGVALAALIAALAVLAVRRARATESELSRSDSDIDHRVA